MRPHQAATPIHAKTTKELRSKQNFSYQITAMGRCMVKTSDLAIASCPTMIT